MKYFHSLLSFILLLAISACSHDPVDTTGTVAGIVKDAVTGANLQGALVSLEGGNSVITGVDGRYQFNNVEMGTYKVSVSRTDYVSDEKSVLVKVREISNLDFNLYPAGSSLEVSPEVLDFGVSDTKQAIDIFNKGQALMSWQIANDVAWLSCSPMSGTVISNHRTSVTITADRSSLARGTYYGSFVVTSKDGGSQTIRVQLTVSGNEASLPQVSILGVDGITDVSASFSGLIYSIGTSRVTKHGFCWSETRKPTLSQGRSCDLGSLDEAQNFSYNYSVTDLTPNTTYYVRAYATNAEGTVYSSNDARFTTRPTVGRPQVETGAVSQTTSSSAVVAGNILAIGHEDGILQYGHVWSSENKEPTTANSNTDLGKTTKTGSFSSTLSALKPGTTYYVRAYATNVYGTSYGEAERFTTAEGDIKLTTLAVSDISFNKATGGGRITDLEGNTVAERGICWATAANPTISHSHAVSSDNTDAFSAPLTGLSENTAYHVRAYAKAVTGKVFYGQDVQFTTTQDIHAPSVSATTVSAITFSGATLSAAVASTGGGTVTDAGFCYSTSANPTTSGPKKSCGAQTASFSATLAGLTPNTRYYVRAYAVNERGTSYGAQTEFTTKAKPADTDIDLDDYDGDQQWDGK